FPWKCDKCDKGYRTKSDVEIHTQSHQDDEAARKPHQCAICGARVTTAAVLLKHMNTHLPDEDPRREKFPCDICGKLLS
ncbi:hypothetical protein PMAYCL1PPCAC_03153, partial [Pristionchus mayeri]